MIKYLIEHGSNLDSKDISQNTPLHHAALNGIKYFANQVKWINQPINIVIISDVDVVIALIYAGANADVINNKGQKPCDVAFESGKYFIK